MIPKAQLQPARDPVQEHRRLVSLLAARAARWGSRDPDAAAQETLRRSLENPKSRQAVEHYLGEDHPADGFAPEWRLDQLLAWLHGVLRFVVREEQSRAAFRRERAMAATEEPTHVSPDALELMVQRELREIVSVGSLEADYRRVLRLRMDGLPYREIARRLGLNENTVATRLSRGIRELGRRIRNRMGAGHE